MDECHSRRAAATTSPARRSRSHGRGGDDPQHGVEGAQVARGGSALLCDHLLRSPALCHELIDVAADLVDPRLAEPIQA